MVDEKKVYSIRSHLKYLKNNNDMKEDIIIIPTMHVMTLRTREVIKFFKFMS